MGSKGGKDMVRMLVVGYGNTLRGDDAVGYQIAEVVQDWGLAGVEAVACHQLTPELADAIATFQYIIFVDAAIAPVTTSSDIALARVEPSEQNPFTTHASTPAALLTLAKWLYDATPVAYQLTIPAVEFEFTESLSPVTAEGKRLALAQLRRMCEEPQQSSVMGGYANA